MERLSIRQITKQDIELIVNYWLTAEDAYLQGMGVDINKMPTKEEWIEMLEIQLNTAIENKRSYCIIWLVDDKPVGHSNVNEIIFGDHAKMHLHLWYADVRKKGIGVELIKLTFPYFFTDLQLKKIYCETYALNEAPNRTLEKVGFTFVKEQVSVPGSLSFEQPTKLWELTLENFKTLK